MISHITIANLATFESLDTDLPVICLVQGSNGVGKTSLAEIINYTLGRGHDDDIIHGAAEFGECLVTFSDGAQVKARASRKTHETVRGWKAAGSKKFTMNREQIDAIGNAIGYNPLSFLQYDEKRQLEELLRVMPIEVSAEEIVTAIGDAKAEVDFTSLPTGANGLESINFIHKVLYDKRRDFNVAADTQAKHAAALNEALPKDGDKDWTAEVSRLMAEHARIVDTDQGAIGAVTLTISVGKEQLSAAQAASYDEIDLDINTRVKALEDERQSRKTVVRDKVEAEVQRIRDTANGNIEAIREQSAPRLAEITAAIAVAKERAQQQQQAIGTRKAHAAAVVTAAGLKDKSEVLTLALDRLSGLKSTVGSRLKIKGIDIKEGRIWRKENGADVPFKKWNEASKMQFCLKVGVLVGNKAGFLMLDGAQNFDATNRAALVEAAKKYAQDSGMQFIVTRVHDGPMKIGATREEFVQ